MLKMKIKLILLMFLVPFMMAASPSVVKEGIEYVFIDGATKISSSEAKAFYDEGVLFIDVRKEKDWKLGHIPKAYNMSVFGDGFNKEALLKKAALDEKIVFYGDELPCLSSIQSAKRAVGYGYTNVYYYIYGYPVW